MLNLTLQQLFGKNATQDNQTLTIYKADLPLLTATANNRAEQLFAALIMQAHQNFEGNLVDEQNRVITNGEEKTITFDNKEIYKKLTVEYWKQQYISIGILDTFIVEVFITPPPPNNAININNLDENQ